MMNCFSLHTNYFPSVAVKPKRKRTLRLPVRKPDPSAPKITDPCKVCGKKFWSEKALYGHMRCHPDRPWRGINPPPNFQTPSTEDEEEVAACLLILANQGSKDEQDRILANQGPKDEQDHKCSVCFRVFSSGQALGGHKRCHRDIMTASPVSAIDLNLAPLIHDDHHDYSSSVLDLRLGL